MACQTVMLGPCSSHKARAAIEHWRQHVLSWQAWPGMAWHVLSGAVPGPYPVCSGLYRPALLCTALPWINLDDALCFKFYIVTRSVLALAGAPWLPFMSLRAINGPEWS